MSKSEITKDAVIGAYRIALGDAMEELRACEELIAAVLAWSDESGEHYLHSRTLLSAVAAYLGRESVRLA